MQINDYKYKRIILLGFRATGKSTIGNLLSSKLNWELYDTDKIIEENNKCSISQLTNNGSNWFDFRNQEYILLKDLMSKHNIIISSGGGIGVNNNIDTTSDKTFGQLESEIIMSDKSTLKILLTAPEQTIANRIREAESQVNSQESSRPLFNNQSNKNDINIEKLIEDSIAVYRTRKISYKKISDLIINTAIHSPAEAVDIIYNKIINEK
jgi:shikimate kinase